MAASSEANNWSISRISNGFGMARETVAKRLENAAVVPAGMHRGYPVYALKDVGPALFSETAGLSTGEIDPNALDPKGRKDWYDSELARIKLEKEMGQLIEASDMARETAELVKSFVNPLDGMVDVLERKCQDLPPDVLEQVQSVVDGVRQQVYEIALGGEEGREEEDGEHE
ncbi:DUF1441 family protein [Parendozoicomonas sp. Alg238-R29]|uniref:DUF1441 family protein n=1 Tax=Parendozoicomonas sp. Alg238-R29 TaxID=2993446 RepID=UPI00248EACBB|nr:DUF1441 family protein [Parendozoicomonas sp. Alg238-R29]